MPNIIYIDGEALLLQKKLVHLNKEDLPFASLQEPFLQDEEFFLQNFLQDKAKKIADKDISLYMCGEVSSSLDVAHTLAAKDLLPVWSAVHAMRQGAGRGQTRRQWHSYEGNIHLSLHLPNEAPFDKDLAALVMALLLCRALDCLGIACKIKWPNDLIAKDEEGKWRKVGGILIEERQGIVLAGFGLNLKNFPNDELLRKDHAFAAGLLPLSCKKEVKNLSFLTLMQALVYLLRICYTRAINSNEDWPQAIMAYMPFIGQTVTIDDGNADKPLRGLFLGLDADGALRLLCDGVEQKIVFGSIRL